MRTGFHDTFSSVSTWQGGNHYRLACLAVSLFFYVSHDEIAWWSHVICHSCPMKIVQSCQCQGEEVVKLARLVFLQSMQLEAEQKLDAQRLPFRRDIGRNLNKLIRSSMDDSTMKKWGYDNQQSRGLDYWHQPFIINPAVAGQRAAGVCCWTSMQGAGKFGNCRVSWFLNYSWRRYTYAYCNIYICIPIHIDIYIHLLAYLCIYKYIYIPIYTCVFSRVS